MALDRRVREALALGEPKGIDFGAPLAAGMNELLRVTGTLGAKGASGDVIGMLGHSADFLELASIVAIGWAWMELASRAAGKTDDFSRGLVQTAKYWLATELPRTAHLASLCESNEPSYLELQDAWLG